MSPAESFSQAAASQNLANQHLAEANVVNPNVELMPVSDVICQDDLELLKSQLAAAHQLLSYQQQVAHSLTEQIHLRDTHLQHAEHQVDDLQQQCQDQDVELSELRAICADLRTQLQRQSRRQSQPSVPAQSSVHISRSSGFEIQPAYRERASISFGYETAGRLTEVPAPLTKAPPVEAWSATHVQHVEEEVTFCQKLTTFIISSTSRVSSCAGHFERPSVESLIERNSDLKPDKDARSMRTHTVELPHFAIG